MASSAKWLHRALCGRVRCMPASNYMLTSGRVRCMPARHYMLTSEITRALSTTSALTHVSPPRVRSLSTATVEPEPEVDDHATFTEKLLELVKDELPLATDPARSAQLLRRLVKSEVLRFTDMRDEPEKFFLAHRLLSSVGLNGFGVRFTVQFNLFAGSIVGLGGPEQVALLDDFQRDGSLGCFLLTEMQAGVLSGLIVETTADYCPTSQSFTLHTPRDAAAKNWISQGFVAERGVVIADLRVGGKSHGPHAFLMKMRDGEGGELLPGIRVEDMGHKTTANDVRDARGGAKAACCCHTCGACLRCLLAHSVSRPSAPILPIVCSQLDNARVWFDKVQLPRSSLLNRFADISDSGEYVQVGEERMRIEVIGQRLLTGRQAIAEAALVSARALHLRTEAYAASKVPCARRLCRQHPTMITPPSTYSSSHTLHPSTHRSTRRSTRRSTHPSHTPHTPHSLAPQICNGLSGERTLASMPQMRAVLDESFAALDDMEAFTAGVEGRLNACLRAGTIPEPDLVDAIAVAKIKCIDVAIQRCHALRQEVGSYALMHATGFELIDMLLCCKVCADPVDLNLRSDSSF